MILNFQTALRFALSFVMILTGFAPAAQAQQKISSDETIQRNLAILNHLQDANMALAFLSIMTNQSAAETKAYLSKSHVDLKSKLPKVSYQNRKFTVEGFSTPIKLEDEKNLGFSINGRMWKFEPTKPIDIQIKKLVRLMSGKSDKFSSLFLPEAVAQEDANHNAKDYTLILGAMAVVGVAVTAVAAAPLLASGTAVAGAAMLATEVAGSYTLLAGFATAASGIGWGLGHFWEKMKLGQAKAVCKDKVLYAVIDGKEIRVDHPSFVDQKLTDEESEAVRTFFMKYNCDPSTVSLVMDKMKKYYAEKTKANGPSQETNIKGTR